MTMKLSKRPLVSALAFTTIAILAGCSAKIEGGAPAGQRAPQGGGGNGAGGAGGESSVCSAGHKPITMDSAAQGATETTFDALPAGAHLEYRGVEYYFVMNEEKPEVRGSIYAQEKIENGVVPDEAKLGTLCKSGHDGIMGVGALILADLEKKADGSLALYGRNVKVEAKEDGVSYVVAKKASSVPGSDLNVYFPMASEHKLYKLPNHQYELRVSAGIKDADSGMTMDQIVLVRFEDTAVAGQ